MLSQAARVLHRILVEVIGTTLLGKEVSMSLVVDPRLIGDRPP